MTVDDTIEAIARTILYEGYLLYPYRLSSVKNRQRWNFGVLYPSAYCEGGSERSFIKTECLLKAEQGARLNVNLRFLQHTGDKIVERSVPFPIDLNQACAGPKVLAFSFSDIRGSLEMSAQSVAASIYKITVKAENLSLCSSTDRNTALEASLISTHKILRVTGGKFISQTSPPDSLSGFAAQCENVRAWPVLVGDQELQDAVLSAPIILPDFPQVAPQSPGDFFDGTEIDEMLSLRILTLSDAEKNEMRRADPRARRLLERTECLGERQLEALHGSTVIRDVPNCPFKPGDRVRLRPRGRADIFDLALDGMAATVLSIECDFEEQTYVCVTVDDDPGRDLGAEAKPGHRFFFRVEEVEPL